MKTTCVIVDDEPQSLTKIKIQVEKTGLIAVMAVFNAPTEAIPEILRLKPDLIFLDMQMPELLGIEMARIIQKSHLCKFIFVTAHPDYALQSFDVDVIHYLIKPVTYLGVFEALTKFLRFTGHAVIENSAGMEAEQYLHLSLLQKNKTLQLPVNQVSYLRSHGKLAVVCCKDGREIQVRESLKTLQKVLPGNRFIKAQRSYIVNLDGITADCLTARYLVLPHTNMHISLGRKARQEVKQFLELNN
jgi:DNA-binding LytR/AlgR family response regulator